MPIPTGFPPRPSTTVRSVRVYKAGIGTADFADNAILFATVPGANPYTPLPVLPIGGPSIVPIAVPTIAGTGTSTAQDPPVIYSGNIRISNDDPANDLEFSFDGTSVHGVLKHDESVIYRQRFEGGIALRGNGVPFRVEAW